MFEKILIPARFYLFIFFPATATTYHMGCKDYIEATPKCNYDTFTTLPITRVLNKQLGL